MVSVAVTARQLVHATLNNLRALATCNMSGTTSTRVHLLLMPREWGKGAQCVRFSWIKRLPELWRMKAEASKQRISVEFTLQQQ